ncbi:hypothetical protein NKH36_19025 [Mesorhizobium sp. M1312]|uniref:hypothetical protein n=1 Tax=unclassified Mesorhizobium TaxID=325217 RepID=UPI003337101C
MHEAQEPNAVVELGDAEPLTAEHGGDLLPVQARQQAVVNLFIFETGLPLCAIDESIS